MSYKVKYDYYPYQHEVCVVGSDYMKYKGSIKGVKEWFEDDEIDRSIGYDYILKKEDDGFSFYLGYGVDNLKDKYFWTVHCEQSYEEKALKYTIELLAEGLDMLDDEFFSWEDFPKDSHFEIFEYTTDSDLDEWYDKYAELLENQDAGLVVMIDTESSSAEASLAQARGWWIEDDEEEYDDCFDYSKAPKGLCITHPPFSFDDVKSENIICAWIDERIASI